MPPDAPLVVDAHNHYWVLGQSQLDWMDDTNRSTWVTRFFPPRSSRTWTPRGCTAP